MSNSRLKIAILADVPFWAIEGIDGYNKPSGPSATWLESLVPEFKNYSDFDVHWITFSKLTKHVSTHLALGQTFHILPRYKKSISMISAYCLETYVTRKLIKSLNPDLVHAWGSEDAYGISGARCQRKKKLFTLQGCLTDCVRRDPHAHPLMKLQARLEKRTIGAYRFGTGESKISTKHLQLLNPDMDVRVIDYGVSREFFAAKWNPVAVPTILFAGTVCTLKGIHELANLFGRPNFRNLNLEIAGEGPSVSAIRALALPNVKFLGKLSRPELITAMERAWLLAVPTHSDTGPSILKEARVVGLPVITTTAAGAAHYICSSGAGEVIAPGAEDSLAKAILKLTKSKLECISTGKRDWDKHRDGFDPAGAAQNFASLYCEIINGE